MGGDHRTLSITGVRVRSHCVLSVLFLLGFKKSTVWLCDCAVTWEMLDAVTDGGDRLIFCGYI